MTLHALHFAIQRLYGFYCELLHQFTTNAESTDEYNLPEPDMEGESADCFDDPEYWGGESIKVWLRCQCEEQYPKGDYVPDAPLPLSDVLQESTTIKEAILHFV